MKLISSRAALLAAAHVIPARGLRYKDAPDIEALLEAHTEKVRKILEGFKGESDEMKVKQAEFQEILRDVEQKMARRPGLPDRGAGGPTWGQQFIESKGADIGALEENRGRVSMDIKATITSSTANAAGSAGDLIIPQTAAIVGLPRQRLMIRNLLNVAQANSSSVEYPKQVAGTNSAAVVAEGAAKPQSDMQFEMETIPMRVIAHWMKASRQILSDVPQLESLIDVELRYGLALVEETELLFGDGTGQHLNGMVTQATAYSAPAGLTDDNMIDQIAIGILQCALTDNEPDGIVLHPADWWRMRLLKDGDGKYLLGDPGVVVQPSLFGLPIVPTKAMTVDKFLVGAFKQQTLYDRWSARVEAGFVNDDFTKNLVTLLGEERVGFAAKRPEALIYGDFGNIS